MSDDGELTLTVGGNTWSGWTKVSVTRSIVTCPSRFDVAMTEVAPDGSESFIANPGDSCTIAIGGDTVVTGYVDKDIGGIGPDRHPVRLVGRGKCEDLVDCSAEFVDQGGTKTGQLGNATAVAIAQALVQPYGITVSASGPAGPVLPQFNLMLGETPWEIIERCCRFAQLLCYEDQNGNLVLGPVGTTQHASGAQQGLNVQSADVTMAMDQRFSEYDAFLLANSAAYGDLGDLAKVIGAAPDPNVLRHRLKYIIAEAGVSGQVIAQQRALWEAARRSGQGLDVKVTVDSWRDSAGQLWTPNQLIRIQLPILKVPDQTLLIGEVTFLRDETDGTRAEISCSPAPAFQPEPILLQPIPPDLQPGANQ